MPNDRSALARAYQDAKASVVENRRVQAVAELDQARWMKRHRHLPPDVLYDRDTGDPLHPELAALAAAVDKAHRDVKWCRGLVIATAEAFKGEPFEKVAARNAAHRGRA